MLESAKSIFTLYENDIVEHVIKQEVKDKRVQMLLQRGEGVAGAPVDLARIAKSSYLGKDPFGDKPPHACYQLHPLGSQGLAPTRTSPT